MERVRGKPPKFLLGLGVISYFLLNTSAISITDMGYRGLSYVERGVVDISTFGDAGVNTFSGNLFVQRELFMIPSRGLPVEIYLTYNSDRRLISSPFGYGWNLSYHIRYHKDSSGNVTIVWGDGRQDTFTNSGTGYTPPAGVYMSLTESSGVLTLTTKYGIKFIFANPTHRKLTSIEDPNGNTITITYDTNYRPITITDAADRVYSLTYNTDGLLSQVVDNNLTPGRAYTFTYDSQGRLTGITDPLGRTESFGYDAGNLITSITDKRGNTTQITYTASYLPQSVQKGGRQVSFSYDTTTRTTTFTDAKSNSWKFLYSSPISRITDPSGNSINFTWDTNKNLTAVTDRRGNTTNLSYDTNGNLTSLEDPLGNVSAWTYGALGRVTSFTDPRGNTWTNTYDANGNPTQTTDPAGNSVTRAFDSNGQMTSYTDREGNTYTMSYDTYGNLKAITDPLGNTTNISYDGASRITQITDPNGNTTGFNYDPLDRILEVVDGLGNADQRTYDENGNLTSYTNRLGNTWSYSYNSFNELTQIVGPPIPDPSNPSNNVNPTVVFTRDANGNVVQITDPRGKNWTYTYDALNRMTSWKDPLGNTWQYAYDPEGNLVEVTDALNQTFTYTYDAIGRLTGQSFPGGTTASYTYDANGNLLTARDANSDYSMSYDNLDRLTSFTDNTRGKTFNYAYDKEGRLTSKTYPGGETVSFTYDAAGRRTSMTTPNGTTNYGYDAAGNRTSIAYHSGHETLINYDANNRVSDIAHISSIVGAFASYTYTRDAEGRITSANRVSAGTPILSADYILDPYGRVLEETVTDNSVNPPVTITLTQAYDPAGNLISYNRFGSTGTVTYDDAGRPTQDTNWNVSGNTTFTHDANGRRTVITIGGSSSITIDYDSRSRMVGAGGINYTYDVFGRLITEEGYATPYNFVYSDPYSLFPSEIYDGSGNLLTRFYKNFIPEAVEMLTILINPMPSIGVEMVRSILLAYLYLQAYGQPQSPSVYYLIRPPGWNVEYLIHPDLPILKKELRKYRLDIKPEFPSKEKIPTSKLPTINYLIMPDFGGIEVKKASTGRHFHPLQGDLWLPMGTSVGVGNINSTNPNIEGTEGNMPTHRAIPGEPVYWGLQTFFPFDGASLFPMPGCNHILEPSGGRICGEQAYDAWIGTPYNPNLPHILTPAQGTDIPLVGLPVTSLLINTEPDYEARIKRLQKLINRYDKLIKEYDRVIGEYDKVIKRVRSFER